MEAQETFTVRVEIHRERADSSGVDVLMVSNKQDHNKPAGWGLPGGGVEPDDESLEIAAVREVYEETGLVISPEDLVIKDRSPANQSQTHINISFGVVIYRPSMGEITNGHDPKKTVDDVQWIPCEELMDAYAELLNNLLPVPNQRHYYRSHLVVICEK